MSRSGGTLLVSMLDAHPEIAMSYELYPDLLKFDLGDSLFIQKLAKKVEQTSSMRSAAELETENWRKFVLRCPRGGIEKSEFAQLLREHVNAGQDFSNERNRLLFVARCAKLKMSKEGKKRWGIKCTSNFNEYMSIWPDTKFLFMVRDGRDMLASQMKVGSFNTTADIFSQNWIRYIDTFQKFKKKYSGQAFEVIYEKLVLNPESSLETICKFIGVEYSQSMINFHKYDNTLFRNPTGHLSYKQLTKGLNQDSIGRWKKELLPDDLEVFIKRAKSVLEQYDYEVN